jgi:hypothetical protein
MKSKRPSESDLRGPFSEGDRRSRAGTSHVMRAAQITTVFLACVLIAGCSKPTSSNTTTTTTTTDTTASASPTSLADAAAATTPPAADASAGAATATASSATTSPAANVTSSATTAANATTTATTAAQPGTVAVAFTDISGNYAEKAIVSLGQLGVLDSTTGTFQPSKPILRREFVRWLYKANNALFADTPAKQIHPADSGSPSGFTDLKPADPDFQYIEGFDAAGISVGFPDKTFKADQPLTHEQAIAIKAVLDRGGIADIYKTPAQAMNGIPDWKDKSQVSKAFVQAIATDRVGDVSNDQRTRIDNVGRTFGAVAMFRPQAPVTRAQAAMLLQVIGAHTSDTNPPNVPRTVAAALNPSPKPTP